MGIAGYHAFPLILTFHPKNRWWTSISSHNQSPIQIRREVGDTRIDSSIWNRHGKGFDIEDIGNRYSHLIQIRPNNIDGIDDRNSTDIEEIEHHTVPSKSNTYHYHSDCRYPKIQSSVHVHGHNHVYSDSNILRLHDEAYLCINDK